MMYDFPIVPSCYSNDVGVITAQNASHHANIVHNIPSTSNNVQYLGHELGHNASLIENNMVTLSVPTQIKSSTVDNTNVCIFYLFVIRKFLVLIYIFYFLSGN